MERLQQVVAAAELGPGDVALDVGTGAGVLLPLIQRYHPSAVVACDLAEEMLAHVHRRYPEVLAIQGDVTGLPLKEATVDAIFMNAMYGNIADKYAACSNAARTLRPGGRLVISHPEGKSFVDQLRDSTDLFVEPFPAREEFQSLVGPLGLQVVAYRDEPKLYLMVARKTNARELR